MNFQSSISKNAKNSKIAGVILFGMFLAGLALWLVLSPIVKGSSVFWGGVVLMAIPSYVALENLGVFGLNAEFVKKFPRFIRITFGVFWGVICILISSLVLWLLSSLLEV